MTIQPLLKINNSAGIPEKKLMPKLGICISPFMGLSLTRLADFGREAEDAGIEGIFIPETNDDGLMCCYAVASATKRLTVATWIANIFLRRPVLCSWAARQIAEEAAGRFILGLGVSHRPLLENWGISVQDPRARLRHYTRQLKEFFEANGASQPLSVVRHIPIYFAALTLETVRLAAEEANGLMLDLCTVNRLKTAVRAARNAMNIRERSSTDFTITTGVPVFVHLDRDKAVIAARHTLARYASLPAYNRMFARSGFAVEMAKVRAARGAVEVACEAITPTMVESVALIGTPSEWLNRFDALGQAGADWIIVRPFAVEGDYETSLHAAIGALHQFN